MNSERPDHDGAGTGAKAPRAAGGSERAGRRRPRAVVTASVAAAVLLAGGGGAYLATSASGGSGGAGESDGAGGGGGTSAAAPGDGTPPPLALDGFPAPSPDGANGVAPGEPNPYGVTYRAGGPLPDGPGSAPVYRAEGEVTAAEVTRLAEALGLEGKPVARGASWTVGVVKDGSGPTLRVDREAPGNWTFQRYGPGSDNCVKARGCMAPPVATDPVSEKAAKKAAAPVLAAVGQRGAALDAGQAVGPRRTVNADPVVGGLPTYGWSTGVTVDVIGQVVSGSGLLKAPAKGDTYPVLDAERTLALLNGDAGSDPRAGVGGCASPVPLADDAKTRPGTACGARETVTVERAVFGLAAYPVEGRQALVPSWLFEVGGTGATTGTTVTRPALDPAHLRSATPTPSPPSEGPDPAPTTRGVEVTGYTAEGDELTAHFTGGVCAGYGTEAREDADEVTLTVTETSDPDEFCILIAKGYEQTVTLDEPLGDRRVVGADGERVPLAKEGARLPAPGGDAGR
ncbi:hypothetical protein [Streptomyces ziwulingensis]|uniref:Membrane protein n=1 Tax=Streptomyces ziwulingensis TaxID=1045501 RepID=A0ABP9CTS1_9ACTN